MCANSSKNVKSIISIFHFWSVKMEAGQIGPSQISPKSNRPQVKSAPVKSAPSQISPKSNRPQVKIIEELKLFSKYSYVLYQ